MTGGTFFLFCIELFFSSRSDACMDGFCRFGTRFLRSAFCRRRLFLDKSWGGKDDKVLSHTCRFWTRC